MRVLIAEDDVYNIEILKGMLDILYPGTTVSVVNDGEEAIGFLKENEVDLILSDVRMPKVDGYELIKVIKTELKCTAPVISVTAYAITGDKEKLLMSGFDGYISKPIDMKSLQATLEPYLGPSTLS